MMGPEEEKHFTVAKTIFLWLCLGTTLATAGTLLYSVRPERPAVRRGFEGGLERELGGPGAVRVSGNKFFLSMLQV